MHSEKNKIEEKIGATNKFKLINARDWNSIQLGLNLIWAMSDDNDIKELAQEAIIVSMKYYGKRD